MGIELQAVREAVKNLDIDNIQINVQNCLNAGIEPWKIIREGMSDGMMEVGRLFENGEYFLADLIMAGEVMKEGMILLEGKIDTKGENMKGTVVLATVKGDIHDIGKNIVKMMLSAAGFDVVDLGSDVSEETIVKAVKEYKAVGVGLSSLLTTMIGSIGDVVRALKSEGLRERVKIAIGGACTSEKLAKELEVDAYGADAVQAVKIFDELLRR